MFFRAIALSLALLVGIGTIIPFMTDYTEAGPKHQKKHKKKKLRKYSKAWWRWYHKKQRRNRAIAARKRALRAHQIILARKTKLKNDGNRPAAVSKIASNKTKVAPKAAVQDNSPAMLPSGETAPPSWQRGDATNSELQFRVKDESGNQLGTASLVVVGNAAGVDSDGPKSKTLGGVSTGSLRRTVIDKMVREEGWVVNDYQKEVGGKKVYVVVAQSNVRGVVQSRLFYFTEVNGRIYSLSTNSSIDHADRIAEESEKVINSLLRANRPTQAELR